MELNRYSVAMMLQQVVIEMIRSPDPTVSLRAIRVLLMMLEASDCAWNALQTDPESLQSGSWRERTGCCDG